VNPASRSVLILIAIAATCVLALAFMHRSSNQKIEQSSVEQVKQQQSQPVIVQDPKREVAQVAAPIQQPVAPQPPTPTPKIISPNAQQPMHQEAIPAPVVAAAPLPTPVITPTPMPIPTPVPIVQEANPEKPFDRYGILTLNLDTTSTSISATDKSTGGNASLYSKTNINFGLDYAMIFSQSFEGDFYINNDNIQFNFPSSNSSITNSSINLLSFGVGTKYWLGDSHTFALGLSVSSDQLPFLRGVSSTLVTVDQVSVPGVTAKAIWNFAHFNPYTVGAEGDVCEYFSTSAGSYTTNSNISYGGRVFIRQDISEKFRLELSGYAKYLNESSSIATQNQTDYGLDVKLSIPIGGNFK